jgi:glycine/serine hydroxymethyltransferase
MTPHYNNTVLIAHSANDFDNYPVINALIDHYGVVPDKILYNGSNIMYMHVAKGLYLTFRDSLNFLGKVSTENDNNFEYDKITIVVDNLPLNRWGEYPL